MIASARTKRDCGMVRPSALAVFTLMTASSVYALTVDLSQATVVTLYLTQEANLSLRPILEKQLRPGARVVSHAHYLGDWVPERVERIIATSGEEHTVYLWRIR